MRAIVFDPEIARLATSYLMSRMTGSTYLGFGSAVRFIQMDTPTIQSPNDVLIKCRLAGICGSDLQILGVDASPSCSVLAHSSHKTKAMLFPGHEIVGEICDIGGKVKGLSIGDRVVLARDLSCAGLDIDPCTFCTEGFPAHFCINRNWYVGEEQRGGGWSEYMLVNRQQLESIGPQLSDETAVLIEPLATAMNAVGRYKIPQGAEVLVLGCGTMGLGVIAALRLSYGTNCRITAIGLHQKQRETALALGANTAIGVENEYQDLAGLLGTKVLGKKKNAILENGFHIAYDCVGSSNTLTKILRWLRPKGKLVLVGFNLYPSRIDYSPIFHRQIDVLGAHGYGWVANGTGPTTTVGAVIKNLESGQLCFDNILTATYPLQDYCQAITDAENKKGEAIKVALDMR